MKVYWFVSGQELDHRGTHLWLQSKLLGKQGPETESQFTFSLHLLPPARGEEAFIVSQL